MKDYSQSMKVLPDLFGSLNMAKAPHKAEVLLLTCIDFRFFDEVSEHIQKAGLLGKFDHIIVAGAELGPVIDFGAEPKLHWQQFFIEHLKLAKELHEIEGVLVLGHRDCGAYKRFLGVPNDIDPAEEERIHEEQAERLRLLIKQHEPGLTFEAHLLEDSSG